MTSSTSRIVVVLLLSVALAPAQTTGGGTTGGGGGTKGVPGSTPTTTPGPSRGRPIPNVQDQEMLRPITLTGRVVMDDGTVPTERVSIERVCNGKPRREAYTDSHGYFSVTIGGNQASLVMQDASIGSDAMDTTSMRMGGGGALSNSGVFDSSGARNLTGCELRAAMAGTTSSVVQLTGRRPFDDPNVGTLVLRRLGKVEGSTVTLTSLQAPGNAKKAFDHARKAAEKANAEEAKAGFAKAVELYPAYAEAWVELAELYLKDKDYENARLAGEKAVAADARYERPYFTLIVLAAGTEDWKRAVELSDKLIALDSRNYPAGYYYNALANYKLHNLDKAEESLRAARKSDPNNRLPKISLLMGTILMDRSDYAGAVQEFRSYLDHIPAEGSDAEFARNALNVAQNKLAALAAPK